MKLKDIFLLCILANNMDFEKLLEERYSKETIHSIATFLVEHPENLNSYLQLIETSEAGTSQRAAWALGHAGVMDKTLLIAYLPNLIRLLEKPRHDSVARNIYRILQFLDIPENFEGIIYDLCIRDLLDPKQPIAVKCFGMTTAFNICKKHVELQPELKIVIEENLEDASAGYKSRARKILPKLKSAEF
ncbi:hypothetical protein Oweho_0686 [Owenweeksia hongkongensis DSM 17368]|uniref:HEAT repeat domain-containing protein n=1 Tax=Owenweeksia hongkongensis (strain DSM 17368 / CIP 108786 / JCM 12287 / NRRL B-23963 / UST20020801) TaxID=926562 RepID=G8R1G1_OWEHD|nr:hypothetical protein [Owenweeksia hongkongensis]AEV31700.1 hypothetical protein Oweho_0686 [Owenweeksia hongkongensis DSM 17368]